jgi:hypothetical protein
VIVFLMEANVTPGPFGEKCLSCVVAQGIPSCFHVVQVFEIATRVWNFHDIIFSLFYFISIGDHAMASTLRD